MGEDAEPVPAEVKEEETELKEEPEQEPANDGKLTGKRSKPPLGGTTPTQQAYRVHTRDLIARLDKILPRNPLTAELVGEKPRRGAKAGRPRNVVLGDLVDIVQKIRMDEVALDLAEEFRKRPRVMPPMNYAQPQHPVPPQQFFRNIGVPLAEMHPQMHFEANHHYHAAVPATIPPVHYHEPENPAMAPPLSHPVPALPEMPLMHQHAADTSFVSSLPPAAHVHTSIDQSSILGGGHQDAEILAWLHEGSETYKGAHPEPKAVDLAKEAPPTEDDFPNFQDVPPCFWNERSGTRSGTHDAPPSGGDCQRATHTAMGLSGLSLPRISALPTDATLLNTSLQALRPP